MELIAFGVGLLWLIYLIGVVRFIGKQRAANRLIVANLEEITTAMKTVISHLAAANKMHGDLNRAAQWLVDRESERAT